MMELLLTAHDRQVATAENDAELIERTRPDLAIRISACRC
jgi:hypothetical protein